MTPMLSAAQPTEASEPLSWRCVLESDASFHVLCRPGPDVLAVLRGALDAAARGGQSSAPRFGPDMRPVAERGDAEVHSADAWRIPLHAAATDPAFVMALLESVLCGKHPRCSVEMGDGPSRLARR